MPLDRGGVIGMDEWDRAPHKSLYRPSASDPATASSTYWRPQPPGIESPHAGSWPDITNVGPEKEKKREICHKAQA